MIHEDDFNSGGLSRALTYNIDQMLHIDHKAAQPGHQQPEGYPVGGDGVVVDVCRGTASRHWC